MKKLLLVLVAAAAVVLVARFFWGHQNGYGDRPAAVAPEGTIENDPRVPRPASANVEAVIAGEWRSIDDASSTRVLAADGSFYDVYGGERVGAPGTWEFSSGELRLSADGEVFRFKLVDVSDRELSLVYLDRGGALRYERVR